MDILAYGPKLIDAEEESIGKVPPKSEVDGTLPNCNTALMQRLRGVKLLNHLPSKGKSKLSEERKYHPEQPCPTEKQCGPHMWTKYVILNFLKCSY